jgi:hypothetical protein
MVRTIKIHHHLDYEFLMFIIDTLVQALAPTCHDVGHDEADIDALGACFDTGDDATDPRPAFGAVVEFAEAADLRIGWQRRSVGLDCGIPVQSGLSQGSGAPRAWCRQDRRCSDAPPTRTRGAVALPCPLDPVAKRSEGHDTACGVPVAVQRGASGGGERSRPSGSVQAAHAGRGTRGQSGVG